jgi:hypothetical protein
LNVGIHIARKTLGLLAGMFLTGVLAFGQITGDVQINVSDQSGGAVAGATFSVKNTGTGATREGTTDNTG